MEMENSRSLTLRGGRREQNAIETKIAEETTPPLPTPSAQLLHYWGITRLYVMAMILIPILIQLLSLKFQNRVNSAFDTHSVFANTGSIVYIALTLILSFYYCYISPSSIREMFSPICYRIVNCVLRFLCGLGPLSFMLMLFLPEGFELIGYAMVVLLFLLVVAYSFGHYIKLPFKKDASNLEAHKRNETGPHDSPITITE